MDEHVNRLCKLVVEINEINNKLEKEKSNFYDGGHSFEEIMESEIAVLEKLQTELKELLKWITL
jgi:hypothetical protein